jgi:hypothetical protein
VNSGSADVLDSTIGPKQPLRAAQGGHPDLGPISPELALVDHVLAEQARAMLPDPRDQSPRRPLAAPPYPSMPLAQGPDAAPVPVPTRPRTVRWPRTAVLAALVFAAGAASGDFLGRKQAAAPRVMLEVQAGAPTTATGTDEGEQTRTRRASTGGRKPAPTRRGSRSDHHSTASTAKRERRRPGSVIWAANVLGVTGGVDGRGVRLDWQRPADSDHVVVLRTLGSRTGGVIVFRGRATSYRDVRARACTAYRYTIVNYDRGGHRSTGVPTSVVTQGCT